MQRLNTHRNGFTLVEVLAALTVLTLVMTSLFVAISGALRNDAQAQSQALALRLAASHLATLGVAAVLSPGIETGTFAAGYEWEQVVTPIEGGDANGPSKSAYWIALTVRPAGAKASSATQAIRLTTLKILDERPSFQALPR